MRRCTACINAIMSSVLMVVATTGLHVHAAAELLPPVPVQGAPPAAPQPAPARPSLNFTHVITADNTIKTCYRNPVLTRTATGALLCFIEERFRGVDWTPNNKGDHACPDNYEGGPGGHNLGVMRSTDLGRTWSPITRLAGNLSNLAAADATDYTNNAIIPGALCGSPA